MQVTSSASTRALPNISKEHLDGYPPDETPCASCASGSHSSRVYGEDPDGFVFCRTCGALLFYCDVGGQG